jgi:hypothetical protein
MGWITIVWFTIAWLMIGVLGLVPGAFIGWLIGKIPIKSGWSIFVTIAVSIALSLTVSKTFGGTGYNLEHHINLLPVFFPPIVVQLLLGRSIAIHSRWNQASYLTPSDRA